MGWGLGGAGASDGVILWLTGARINYPILRGGTTPTEGEVVPA